MKRIIIYCIVLAAVLLIPVKHLDVGNLEPVQAVWVYEENARIVLKTDTNDKGSGNTVAEALQNLEENCLGIIYLDTAEFLLVAENMESRIPELKAYLKGSVKVCQWDGEGSVEAAARYMDAHKIGYKLRKWDTTVNLPKLTLKNGDKMSILPS